MFKGYVLITKKDFTVMIFQDFRKILAGITVAAVALPLALAFGVSSGADASAGLITAIIAGLVIGGLSGGFIKYQVRQAQWQLFTMSHCGNKECKVCACYFFGGSIFTCSKDFSD